MSNRERERRRWYSGMKNEVRKSRLFIIETILEVGTLYPEKQTELHEIKAGLDEHVNC